jgi:hypothetical protein
MLVVLCQQMSASCVVLLYQSAQQVREHKLALWDWQ